MHRSTSGGILMAALLVAAAASAREWRLIGPVTRAVAGKQQVVGNAELDASSVTLVDGIVKAWIRENYPREVTGGPVPATSPYLNTKIQFGFKCEEHRAAILAFIGYRADGTVADAVRKTVEEASWNVVAAGSEQDAALTLACGLGIAHS